VLEGQFKGEYKNKCPRYEKRGHLFVGLLFCSVFVNTKYNFKPIKIDVSFAVSDVSLSLHEPQNP